ncbi:unnamed protein product [Caenorhabditis auriculariae]|uniref:Domain of unknown function DB domain-containing protein n=1 Tax=Caenorhabditis auriculariae TaxID=2777116 RepID=A0A8S1H890_9PELO|nr:unnamed protein product [Caenorhabditis auriculariae]
MRWVILLLLVNFSDERIQRGMTYKRRLPSAFTLARLQKKYDEDYETESGERQLGKNDVSGSRKRDDVVSDVKCLQRCNNRLNIGMDMVNAHMAFGSIDVPSVVDRRDLELFCLLDYQHSQCIDECGYSVQFNLREYVCRNRFPEMLKHLPCYARSSGSLIRHCRPRCGGYKPLMHTAEGYAKRCRQLLCDHTCVSFILKRICPEEQGEAAANYLLDFTRLQVDYWMREYSKDPTNTKSYPTSCARLQCDDFRLANCRRQRRG